VRHALVSVADSGGSGPDTSRSRETPAGENERSKGTEKGHAEGTEGEGELARERREGYRRGAGVVVAPTLARAVVRVTAHNMRACNGSALGPSVRYESKLHCGSQSSFYCPPPHLQSLPHCNTLA